jgi:hypothetical protein
LSWLLSVAMVWPALIFLLASGPSAKAQVLQRSSQPLWTVLDFENHSGYGGPEVGRSASDAFVVELGKSNKYQVLSRAETEAGLASLGETPPLDVVGAQKLGRALQTDAVATGEVAAIQFSKSPRQATVSVIVRVVDTNTGELVNGALAQGTSNPRAISSSDDDALVNEAINNAAFAAVRQIIQFNLPKATVLNNEDQNRVLLNKGTRDGLYDGLNMVVTRNGSEVGRIRVVDASQDQSDAVVTRRGLGIQPQDRATSIYQLPSYSVSNNALVANPSDVNKDGSNQTDNHHSAFSGVTGVLLAILAGVLLVSLVRRGSSSGSVGGAAVGKPVAVEGRADVLGGSGIAPGTDQYAATFGIPPAPPLPSDYFPITVRITATVGNVPFANFIEYHIYRSNFPAVLQDASILGTVTGTTQPTGFGQVPVIVQSGSSQLLEYDDGGDKIGITASKPTPITLNNNNTTTTTTTTTTGGGNNNGGNSLNTVTVSLATGIPGTGIQQVGDRFFYLIEGLYQQQVSQIGSSSNTTSGSTTSGSNTTGGGSTTSGSNTTGGGNLVTNYYLTGRSNTNYVTYLEPVIFTQGDATSGIGGSFGTSTSPDNVIVSVPSTRSADTYVLDLSTDISFPSNSTTKHLSPDSTGPYTATAANPRNGNAVSWFLQTGSKSGSLRQLYPTATQVFARIGCRDSRNTSNSTTNPYVYTDPVAVPSALVPDGTGGGVGGPPAAPAKRHH